MLPASHAAAVAEGRGCGSLSVPRSTPDTLLVSHPQLASLLTVLSEATAACKIIPPSRIAHDNILKQLQTAWHVALSCAVSAQRAVDEEEASASDGAEDDSTLLALEEAQRHRGSARPAPVVAAPRPRSWPRPPVADDDVLESTITGMLRTVGVEDVDAVSSCDSGSSSGGAGLLHSPNPEENTVGGPPGTPSPQQNDMVALSHGGDDVVAAARTRRLYLHFHEQLLELLQLVESVKNYIVRSVFAHYFSISLISSSDLVLRRVAGWLAQHPTSLESTASSLGGAIPFVAWMHVVVEARPTTAAVRLLGRCLDVHIVGTLESAEVVGAEGVDLRGGTLPCEAAPQSSVFSSIVVAARAVAPCHHVEECLGNLQLLLVESKRGGGDEAAAEEEDVVHTVLARECSVGCVPPGGAGDRGYANDEAIVSGTLLENKLSCGDRSARPWTLSSTAVPYSSPAASQWPMEADHRLRSAASESGGDAAERHLHPPTDDWMYSQHFPDHHVSASRAGGDQHDEHRTEDTLALMPLSSTTAHHHNGNIDRGPRAGDGMFISELTARLDFWIQRGSTPRDFGADFVRLALEEQESFEQQAQQQQPPTSSNSCPTVGYASDETPLCQSVWQYVPTPLVAPLGSRLTTTIISRRQQVPNAGANHPQTTSGAKNNNSNGRVRIELSESTSIPLHCFASVVGTLSIDMFVSEWLDGVVSTEDGSDDHSAAWRSRELQSNIRLARHSLRGCVLSVLAADEYDGDASPSTNAHDSDSSPATKNRRPFGVQITAFPDLAGSLGDLLCTNDSDVDGRAAVELRKLQHKLLMQSRWRGILWDASTGKAKATLVLTKTLFPRCHHPAEAGAGGQAFSVEWQPYIAPLRWYIRRHCLLLVDLDRTIVDNSITAASAQLHQTPNSVVSWFVQTPPEQNCHTGAFSSSMLRPKSEQIFLRRGVPELLNLFVGDWNCTAVLATKSTRARAQAILSTLVDPHGALFGRRTHAMTSRIIDSEDNEQQAFDDRKTKPTPSFRIFAAEDIVGPSPSPLTPHHGGASRTYTDALLRARKSAATIFCSSVCSGDVPKQQSTIRYAVLDDTPLVWEEEDWTHVVPVVPFTLSHVDAPSYWSCDGGVLVYQLLQKLVIGCGRKRQRQDGDSNAMEDEGGWWSEYLGTHDVAVDEDGPSNTTVVVEEEDDGDDGDSREGGASLVQWSPEFTSSSGGSFSRWKNSAEVEDVVPIQMI